MGETSQPAASGGPAPQMTGKATWKHSRFFVDVAFWLLFGFGGGADSFLGFAFFLGGVGTCFFFFSFIFFSFWGGPFSVGFNRNITHTHTHTPHFLFFGEGPLKHDTVTQPGFLSFLKGSPTETTHSLGSPFLTQKSPKPTRRSRCALKRNRNHLRFNLWF